MPRYINKKCKKSEVMVDVKEVYRFQGGFQGRFKGLWSASGRF